jgi:CBS domain-containing protein
MGAEPKARSRLTVTPKGEVRAAIAPGGSTGEYVAACDATWTPIVECMKDPICLSPDLSLDAALTFFLEAGISAAPVAGPQGELRGMITRKDAERHRASATVSDAMTPTVVSVPETATLGDVAALMVENRFRLVPIVNAKGEVQGVVSPYDLLSWVI